MQMRATISEEIHSMSLRSLANKALALSPLFLIGSVCLMCRSYADPFEQVGQTAEQQAAISAYIAPVKATYAVNIRSASPDAVRRVANIWVEGWANGTLKPMLPCAMDDTITGPIKNQIYMANMAVVEGLDRTSQKEALGGQYALAAEDVVLALKCGEVAKYSDPVAVFVMSESQRYELKRLERITEHLSATDRSLLKRELSTLKGSQLPLDSLYLAEKFSSRHDAERATSNETASYDPIEANEVGFVEDPTTFQAALTQIQSGAKRVINTPYLQMTKLAFVSQSRLITVLDGILETLGAGNKAKST